ncbi:MAG: helix-turn-helix domain-containing protein [Candidatus Eisenbacteria bacterium]|nr:helix-turn-helix domain-containing protein [Candidatus Eisenbacteria bacterium]
MRAAERLGKKKGRDYLMPTKAELGQRLRIARFERNLTLKEVAARCGMSATHISEVERGKTSPTIGALERIAGALGENPAYFVQDDDLPKVEVTRLRDRNTCFFADDDGKPFEAEVLSRGIPGGYVQVFQHSLPPGESLRVFPMIGEVVIHCLGGMVRMTAEEQSHVLREGDTIQMRLDNGVATENIGDEDSEVFAVLAAPSLFRI